MSTEQVTKPFDLEAAKAGKPVCTKWGLPVRIVCWDLKAKSDSLNKIIGLVDVSGSERVLFYGDNGQHPNREYDLRMAPEVLTQWVNILEAVVDIGTTIKRGDRHVCCYNSEVDAKYAVYSEEHWKCILRNKRVDIEF